MDFVSDFLAKLLGSTGSTGVWDGLVAVLFAYLGGVLSSLTPCIYPMIPITVGVVGGIGHEKRTWSEVLARGFSYVSGMAVTYSFLGVLAGLTGKVFGTLTNTAGWYLTLGLILSVAALWMLDVFNFDPMASIQGVKRRFERKKTGSATAMHQADIRREMTHLGAFLLGASSGFIAAPCTTPVLTSILAYIAKTQSIGLGLALMLSFSLGLGTILLLIATFTGATQILPRSGKWMETVKKLSGLVLLAFADYLIYRAGSIGGFLK